MILHSSRDRPFLLRTLAVLGTFLLPATASAQTVAFVELAVSGGKKVAWSEVGHVLHNGLRVENPGQRLRLEPGDQLFVDQPGAVVLVHKLAEATFTPIMQTTAGKPAWVAKAPSIAGLVDNVITWLEEQLGGADQSRLTPQALATMGTRGKPTAACGDTRTATDPAMPMFTARQSSIVAGRRALIIPWNGGSVPYEIKISDANGIEIVHMDKIVGGCVARLPSVEIRPGQYRVSLKDGRGAEIVEGSLFAGDAPPPMPAPLRDAQIPEVDRQLYYATWLASIDTGDASKDDASTNRGRWTLEAIQIVGAMDCRSQAVKDWLAPWGGAQICGS